MTDLPTKKLWLAEAELALHRLETGTAEVTVAFGSGKSVTYSQAHARDLRAYVDRLKAEIAQMEGTSTPRRGPIRWVF
jgi:hypothetical protein